MRNIRLALALIVCAWFAGASAQYVPLRDGVIEVTVAPSGTCAADATAARNAPAQFVQSTGVTWYCDTGTLTWTASPSGGSGLSGLTSGRVPYATSSTTIGDDPGGPFWDATNDGLGVGGTGASGLTSSVRKLVVRTDQNGSTESLTWNATDGTASQAIVGAQSTTGAVSLVMRAPTWSNAIYRNLGMLRADSLADGLILATGKATAPVIFHTADVERGRITPEGWFEWGASGVATTNRQMVGRFDQSAASEFALWNNSSGSGAQSIVRAKGDVGSVSLIQRSSTYASPYANVGALFADSASDGLAIVTTKAGAPVLFRTQDTERMRLTDTGLGIGKTPTVALDVQGNALVSGTLSHAGGDIGPATATTPSVGDNDTSVATTAFARAGFLSKNGYLVTVCASGCDYSTVQSALDGTTGTASQPVTILLMPGTYSECVNVDETDDYKTLAASALSTAKIECTTSGERAVEYTGASGSDLDSFALVGLTLANSGASLASTVYFDFSAKGDARVDLRVEDCTIDNDTNGGTAIQAVASATSIPAKAASEIRIVGNKMSAGNGVVVGNNANVYGANNQIRLSTTSTEAKCWGDHGAGGLWNDTTLYLVGEDCVTVSRSTSDADSACGACFYYGMELMQIVGMSIDASTDASATNGPMGVGVGVSPGNAVGILDVVDTTIRYATTAGGTSAGKGLVIMNSGRMNARNVRIFGTGPASENDVHLGSTSTAQSYLRHEGIVYDSQSLAGSGKFQALNPKVVKSFLRAVDSVALPATGAPLDANSEYGLFDAAADENRSWRNERVSDLYEAQSLETAKFRVYWKPDTATSGDVIWRVGICAATNDGAFPCTVSSFASVTDTVSGGASGDLYISDWTALPTGILTAGYGLVVTASRDADNGSDTMTGDAALIGVEISYGVK